MAVQPLIPGTRLDAGTEPPRPKTADGAAGEPEGTTRDHRPEGPPVGLERLEALREEIGKMLRASHSSVQLSFDKDLERIIAKIVDDETGEVIRQYPPSEMLAVLKRLQELRGMLLDRKG